MNYFFSISNDIFSSKLTIPKFQNCGFVDNSISLYSAIPKNTHWLIEKINLINDFNNDFYFLDNNLLSNEKIFFLGKQSEVYEGYIEDLKIYNKYTSTFPDYRSNLSIQYLNKGFSSYQSEYPFGLISKNRPIMSSIFSLLDDENDINYLCFKNISLNASKKSDYLYIVDVNSSCVLDKKKIFSNFSNFIEINKKFIKPNVYIVSKFLSGIPIYIGVKNGHLSMEHTHPPHLYIWSNKHKKNISLLKEKLLRIIDKE